MLVSLYLMAAVAEDKLLFYVVHPEECDRLNSTVKVSPIKSIEVEIDGQFPERAVQIKQIAYPAKNAINSYKKLNTEPNSAVDFGKQNNFNYLASELLSAEWDRVSRGELSASSIGIQKTGSTPISCLFSGTYLRRKSLIRSWMILFPG